MFTSTGPMLVTALASLGLGSIFGLLVGTWLVLDRLSLTAPKTASPAERTKRWTLPNLTGAYVYNPPRIDWQLAYRCDSLRKRIAAVEMQLAMDVYLTDLQQRTLKRRLQSLVKELEEITQPSS